MFILVVRLWTILLGWVCGTIQPCDEESNPSFSHENNNPVDYDALFTLPDSDTDSNSYSDCKPNGYIVVCRTFHTAQSQIQIPILIQLAMESEWDQNRNPDLWM